MSEDIQRAIGRVEGKLDLLLTTTKQREDRADEARKALYARVDGVASDIVSVAARVGANERAIGRIEPLVRASDISWARRAGALAVVAGLGGSGLVAIVLFVVNRL